ncbi:hypothetical protein [Krasilnikovia sp. MM14-A1259]|uniref:hypothetical protein n=1 Tax=Krasilnikovia sp. MM14-A1259 TaxID=3373539 RepID=UPI0037FBAE72
MSETDSVAHITVAVQRSAWASVCPTLPPEAAAMVAPPVVVTLGPVGTDAVPAGPEPAPAAVDPDPDAPRHAAPGQPRPASAPGRHRRTARAN